MNLLRNQLAKFTRPAEVKAAGVYPYFREISSDQDTVVKMNGKDVLMFGSNSYLGLTNHPKLKEASKAAIDKYGLGCAGSRFLNGSLDIHTELEEKLAKFVGKDEAIVFSSGYKANLGAISSVLTRHDYVILDDLNHACIIDGVRLHMGKRFTYKHNDMESIEKNLERATKMAEQTGGGILVISEGVFGMRGEQGKLKEIVALKKKYNFRLLVDDAHGFGTLGATGAGAGEEQGVQDEIDVYFATFAKSMASTGAFIAGDQEIIDYLKYNLRSQMFAKSLQMQLVVGALKRLDMLRSMPELREKLWENVNALQGGLKERAFDIGTTQSCVTPVSLKGSVAEAMALVKDLRENHGVFCSIVVYPVIPKGLILLRMIPTASHTLTDVSETLEAFETIRERLDNGTYKRLSAAVATQFE